MKLKHACGLLVLLLLSAVLMPFPAHAKPTALEWTKLDKPGLRGNIIVSPSEVSEIAIGSGGVFYATDNESSKVYRSLEGGATWEDVTPYLIEAGAGLPASKVVVAPGESRTVAVVTNAGTRVYLSTDRGDTWNDTGVPSLAGTTIQAITISGPYGEAGRLIREIAIGTANWSNSTTTGQVWILRLGVMGVSWRDQGLSFPAFPASTGGEVSAIAYSPNYRRDRTILVVASTSSDVSANYTNKTWLCLGEREPGAGTTSWNTVTGYPVEVATTSSPSLGDAPGVSQITSSLALPSDYVFLPSTLESSRRVFVSYDRKPNANDDVYRLDNIIPYRLNANGGNAANISSIAYFGTLRDGKLLAGDASNITGSLTVQVRRTSEPFESPPDWSPASQPPSGTGNAKLSWSPDGKVAYCGTSQSPRAALDESAFSSSSDGDAWQQLSLVDTTITFSDIAPTPDSQSLFAATYSSFGPEGVWRTTTTQLGVGRYWSRQLTMDTTSNKIIIRLSPDYASDYTIYVAEVGGNLMAVSHTRGNSWKWRRAPGWVIDMVIEDKDTIHVALPGGYVSKSTNGALSWRDPVETKLSDINMLAITADKTILVGGRNGEVAYSTNFDSGFTRIPEVIGSGTGDVQVAADVNYKKNGIIYAAANLSDKGIWRWATGASTGWEQIDESITALNAGQRIAGLMVGSEGTLYALRLESANSTRGGMTRSVNPSEPELTKVEFDLVNYALPAGTTFNPTVVFANTLPYLKLSGDSGQNELWAVDTANQTIYRFQDTLCKVGPTLQTPKAGATIPISSSGYVTSLTLGWEEQSGTRTYEVAIYLDSGAREKVWSDNSTTAGITAGAVRLIRGTTYYWRARSTKPIKSPWSETRSFTSALGGAQWSPFTTPTLVAPSAGATNVPIRPAFQWNAADRATGYEFVLARNSEFTDVVIARTGADALPTAVWGCDRDLDYSATYFWRVRAISATSQSEWGIGVFTTEAAPSTPLPAPPLPAPPSPPPSPPASNSSIPSYLLGVAIGVGATLVLALLILIAGTGR